MKIFFWILSIASVFTFYNQTLGKTFSELTIASYCKLQDITSWKCKPCQRHSDIKNVHVWKNSTHDTVGFIAIKDNLDAIFLVFRGTLPWDTKNWMQDINFIKTQYPLCNNECQVHRGFYHAYLDIQDQVIKSLADYIKLYNKTNIYVTGHSLGAAIATHCVAHLLTLNYTIKQFYTIGGPRVGDKKFKEWFNTKYGDRFKARITYHKDPVPHLPYQSWGFQHHNTQVFYTTSDFSTYKICNESGEDNTCANQYLIFNTVDHLRYFGYHYLQQGVACFFI